MIICMSDLYGHTIVITNRSLVQGDFLEQLKKVARLHPYAMILREKDLSDEEYEQLAEQVLAICEAEQVRLFVHSKTEIAKRIGCRGIHMTIPGLQALSEWEVRELHGCFTQVSVSCHSLEDMQYAVQHGATQIVLGTIFETECKKGLKGRGVAFVEEICRQCPVPVYAIGGINEKRLPQVMAAGAAGGCMMSGFMRME